jgi:hypothetical protein
LRIPFSLPRPQVRFDRRWRAAGIVLLLLLVEWFLPTRLASMGVSALFALAALALAVYALPRPWLALALLLAYGPFAATVRFSGASNVQSLLKDLLALAAVAVWLVQWLMQRRPWVRTALDWPLGLLLVLMGVQVLHGPDLLRGILALKIAAVYIPVYFLVVHNPPNRTQLRRLLWVLFAVAAVTALYGLYQSQTLSSTSTTAAAVQMQIEGQPFLASSREGQVRVFSTFTHSTVFSLYLSLMIALGLTLLGILHRWHRLLLLGVLVLLVVVLPLTLSRVGWIGTLLGPLVLLLIAPRLSQRLRYVFLGILILVIFLVAAGPTVERVLSWSFTRQDLSFQQRQLFIGWSLKTLVTEVPLGCGMGVLPDAADLAVRLTRTPQQGYLCLVSGGRYMQGADTIVLSIAAQTGIPGYLLYLWIFFALWRGGIHAYRHLQDAELRALASGLLAYLAIMTFGYFFSSSTQAYPVVDLYFWFFAGLLMSLERIEQHWARQEGALAV